MLEARAFDQNHHADFIAKENETKSGDQELLSPKQKEMVQ